MRVRCSLLLALLCVLLLAPYAYAQTTRLTTQQLATLRAAITADPVLAAEPNNADGHTRIVKALNLDAAPAFTVWRTSVMLSSVGKVFLLNGVELAGLTTGNHTRLHTVGYYVGISPINPSQAGVRAYFDDVFSGAGGVNTRAGLLALWKRLATRFEKLYATGTGSDAAPATLVLEGAVTLVDVEEARR
jgi:hypothetical protein